MYTRRRRTPPHGRSAIVQTQLAYAFVHGVRQLSVRKLDFIPIYTTHSRGYAVTRTGRRRRREGFASSRARRGQGWNGNANGSKHYTDGRRRGPSCVHPERIIKRYKRLCFVRRHEHSTSHTTPRRRVRSADRMSPLARLCHRCPLPLPRCSVCSPTATPPRAESPTSRLAAIVHATAAAQHSSHATQPYS